MSDGLRIPYAEAMAFARTVENRLDPFCQRVVIAGSLRRFKETVGDIELVLIPKHMTNLFGDVVQREVGIEQALIQAGFVFTKNGMLYKQVYHPEFRKGSVMIDLFLTIPEKWGCIFTIRTGSADFSHKLVTKRMFGGWCPDNLHFKNGRLWDGYHDLFLDTPEEMDVFDALGMKYVDPVNRNG